jgi:CubicO group peptidase (beta-lactamase class C family)
MTPSQKKLKTRPSRDDPVEKYLPQFKPRLDGFDPSKKIEPSAGNAPISLFQLGSHMSGLGRDWPPGIDSKWPDNIFGSGPPPTNGHPFPSHEAVYKAISETRLVSPPGAYPSYSNTGAGVLGSALVAANLAAFGPNQPDNYADLAKRDIFEPMGLNGSHFLVTEANKHLVVVPSLGPEVAVGFIYRQNNE